MSSERFHIIFDGPALENHEMNVRDLAPSLLAISDVFDEINRVAMGGQFKVAVNVRASFKTGSFLTELAVYASNVLAFFKDDTVQATLLMLQFLGVPSAKTVASGIIQFVKWVRNRKITRIVELEKNKVRVFIDNDSIEVEKEIIELYKSIKLRKAMEELFSRSLEKEGIESVGLGNGEAQQFVSIQKEDGPLFVAEEPEDEPMGESTRRAHLQLISPCFQEGNKWRFGDGSASYHAEIRDKAFSDKVMRGDEVFAKGDILDVDLTEIQTLTATGLKMERYIDKVHSIRNPDRQLRLPV